MKSTDQNQARSRMCPVCFTPGAIVPYVKDDAQLSGIVYTGVECQTCGWKKADDRAQHHDITCMDCRRAIGPKRAIQDRAIAPISCSDCSIKHLERNNPRPVKVRFDVRCPGCDKLLGHYDHWESKVIANAFRIPTYLCDSVACQMKFAVPKEGNVDLGAVKKGIENILADLNDGKISKADAAVAVVRVVNDAKVP